MLNRHSPDSESVGPDPPSLALAATKFQNSLAANLVTAPKGGLVGLAAPKLVALPLIKAHLYRRRLSHLVTSSGHAGAGGARNRAISDRISANICRGTATSASWKVT